MGTGSGYQTAILASLCERLYSVERIAALLDRARDRLVAMGARHVRTRVADGHLGWPSEGPFDGILVTAAARRAPDALVEQLADGGRMIIPVGDDVQKLLILDRDGDTVRQKATDDVRFVPLRPGVARPTAR